MAKSEEWQPRPSDLEWCQSTVNMLKDGGFWEIPRTGQVFKVYKEKKELHLLRGDVKDRWLFLRTVKCFNALGWKVFEARPDQERSEITMDWGQGKTRS